MILIEAIETVLIEFLMPIAAKMHTHTAAVLPCSAFAKGMAIRVQLQIADETMKQFLTPTAFSNGTNTTNCNTNMHTALNPESI
jgi:hypothetical protein